MWPSANQIWSLSELVALLSEYQQHGPSSIRTSRKRFYGGAATTYSYPKDDEVCDWMGLHIWNEWAALCVAAVCAASSEADHSVVTTPLLEMPVQELAYWMGKFVPEARKAYVSEYLLKTLLHTTRVLL